MPPPQSPMPDKVTNEFALSVATANGSGSQSANLVLLRSLFGMGLPVTGKNIFPSNIQGLPTWYQVRVSEAGYAGPRSQPEIGVLMNPDTFAQDLAALPSGGVALINADLRLEAARDDIHAYAVPCTTLAREVAPKLAKLVTNMVYVGALAQLLDIERGELAKAIERQFPGKAKAVEINNAAIDAGMAWVAQNTAKTDPFTLARRDLVAGKFLVEGNEAAALGSVFGGVGLLAWYPITPSSSLPEALIAHLADLRHDPDTGAACYAVVQAEDEIAAAGMVLGAGWAGARAMTATSGPGLALMAEFVGLGYFAEIPSVFWNIQRVGPSTGLPTRTQQADLAFVHTLSHGDTRHILLFPGTVEECFEFGWRSLDYAQRFQTPIFVLSDLDLGMNNWMSERFAYPDTPLDRGKVLSKEELERVAEFGRYADPDGDGIPYRSLPGTDHPKAGYLTRGSGHNEQGIYTESGEVYARNMARIARKVEGAASALPAPVVSSQPGAKVGIISFGSTLESIREARDRLAAGGLATDHLRLRALPLSPEVAEFVAAHDQVVVVEANRDAQLLATLKSLLPANLTARLLSAAWSDGLQMAASDVVARVEEALNG